MIPKFDTEGGKLLFSSSLNLTPAEDSTMPAVAGKGRVAAVYHVETIKAGTVASTAQVLR